MSQKVASLLLLSNSNIFYSGISSLCFTNHGEALYMMSSSEVQRITLSGKKIVSPNGCIELEEWDEDEEDEKADKTEDGDENTTMEATTPISAANSDNHLKSILLNFYFR